MQTSISKISALALLVAFSFGLVACGGGDDKDSGKKKTNTNTSSSSKSDSGSKSTPAAGVDMTKVGSVKGKVMFAGTAPTPEKRDVSRDSWCKDHAEVFDESLVVNSDGGLRDVVVYIEGLEAMADKFPAPEAPAQLRQQGCNYVPHVLCLRVDQELEVINADDTSHNYHFEGKMNDSINKTQPKPGTDIVEFDSAEMGARFKCDIHPWMNCNVHIFEHPCFSVSAADGSFTIKGIPAGSYKLRLMHANAKAASDSIDVMVTAGGTKDVGTIKFN